MISVVINNSKNDLTSGEQKLSLESGENYNEKLSPISVIRLQDIPIDQQKR